MQLPVLPLCYFPYVTSVFVLVGCVFHLWSMIKCHVFVFLCVCVLLFCVILFYKINYDLVLLAAEHVASPDLYSSDHTQPEFRF